MPVALPTCLPEKYQPLKRSKKYKKNPLTEKLHIGRAQLDGLDLLAALLAPAQLPASAGLQAGFARIGEILYSNALRLQLDEDSDHLLLFARSIAGEVMSTEAAQLFWEGASCWDQSPGFDFPPFIKKGSGARLSVAGVLAAERTQQLMAAMFLWVLRTDPDLQEQAQLILDACPDFAHLKSMMPP